MTEGTNASMTASVETAVAAEWNAMRARIWDAHAAGLAGATGAGVAVAQSTFARFENASGEYGAHEMLESTSESNYEGFEEALGAMRTEGLDAGDMSRAADEAHSVSAYGDSIPEDASYWASGGFESEEAARTGWDNGEGAVQSGHYYTHTFETTGTHDYFCIPHEGAGMEGSITVE